MLVLFKEVQEIAVLFMEMLQQQADNTFQSLLLREIQDGLALGSLTPLVLLDPDVLYCFIRNF